MAVVRRFEASLVRAGASPWKFAGRSEVRERMGSAVPGLLGRPCEQICSSIAEVVVSDRERLFVTILSLFRSNSGLQRERPVTIA